MKSEEAPSILLLLLLPSARYPASLARIPRVRHKCSASPNDELQPRTPDKWTNIVRLPLAIKHLAGMGGKGGDSLSVVTRDDSIVGRGKREMNSKRGFADSTRLFDRSIARVLQADTSSALSRARARAIVVLVVVVSDRRHRHREANEY